MIPESMLWLLLSGKIPLHTETETLRVDLLNRATLPEHVIDFIKNIPQDMHQ